MMHDYLGITTEQAEKIHKLNMADSDAAKPIRARATELHGSNAGAGSGTLALYRKHRKIELERVEQMEKEQERGQKMEETREKQRENAAMDQARTDKNRKKRPAFSPFEPFP